jgi:hypothetical protein
MDHKIYVTVHEKNCWLFVVTCIDLHPLNMLCDLLKYNFVIGRKPYKSTKHGVLWI